MLHMMQTNTHTVTIPPTLTHRCTDHIYNIDPAHKFRGWISYPGMGHHVNTDWGPPQVRKLPGLSLMDWKFLEDVN